METRGSFVYLNSANDLEKFRQLAFKYIGVLFPLSYLQDQKVVAFIDRKGEIRGGFALITNGDFRVVESLPDLNQKRFKRHYPNYRETFFEITALFFDPSIKRPSLNFQFYFRIYIEILKTKRTHFIYAYSADKPKLGLIYQFARPHTLFCGLTKLLPGMAEVEEEVVEIVRVRDLHLIWIKNPQFMFRRLIRKRRAREIEEMVA